jgi:hypothetical protein
MNAPTRAGSARGQLERKSAHLSAMLALISGEGFTSFNAYSDEIRDQYLWACADLAAEVSALTART